MKVQFRWKVLTSIGIVLFVLSTWLCFFKDDRLSSGIRHNFEDNIYIYRAYRVHDDEIRIAIVTSHRGSTKILYHLDGSDPKLLNLECQRDGECPAAYSPLCVMSGYVGTIKDLFLVGRDVETVLLIGERSRVSIRITDVRKPTESTEREHKLGVCLQPVFMHADWPQFVQFFEYWLEEGATKFFIYWESYTDEVKRIINFYKAHSRVDIQLIEWSKLPTFSINPDTDPNFYWYRLEAFMAIFDCMHQARWNVHFVAQSDLDELFYVTADRSLLNYLHWLEFKNPSMASVNFVSRRVRVPNYWDRISSPHELNFSPFLETELESHVFKRPLYMKNIYIPERVKRFDIHFQRETEETSPTSSLTYTHLNASVHHGMVLHLRRTDSIFSWSGSKVSRELVMLANRMERSYLRRLAADQTGLCEFFVVVDYL